MEIAIDIMTIISIIVFKIDLIVWKFWLNLIFEVLFPVFKIDLIVWKSKKNVLIGTGQYKFKIDLIVWKSYSNTYGWQKGACLK